jgi:nuclear transport factor 2 (NTF2) superfamily protein
METIQNLPIPPWDMEHAAKRLKLLENDFNSLNAEKISANFTKNAEVRFGTHFLTGREAIGNFIADDLAEKKAYKINLNLWGALKGRMAVRYELEWKDANNVSFKSFGVQVYEFDAEGLIEMNFSSYNDQQMI